MRILLGYVVPTGEPVYLEDGHTVITGMTQLSGKTTSLEALVERGEIVAVTFLTKRGEKGFRDQREIQPYFKEQKKLQGARKHALIDWQYVSAILEATMSERMKFERSWIINACRGARSLQEVYENIKKAQKDATRSLDQSIYTNLAAYFEIILPEIKKYNFAEKLRLTKGFNVMNLIGMADEMQQLVIESVISYVRANLEDVVIVLPEAHKFIPQGLKTPVKQTALLFIREGATNRNFMWIDTQETTSVDKSILKQCSNWIMGYQQEKNEVANVRENIGRKKITEEMIMSLKLGHFIASLKQKIYHLYVLPSGIEEKDAIDVAKGMLPPEAIRDMMSALPNGRDISARGLPYIEVEQPYEETTVMGTQDAIKLQTEVVELGRKVVEVEDRLEKVTVEFAQEKLRLENEIEDLGQMNKELSGQVDERDAKIQLKTIVMSDMQKELEKLESSLTRYREFEQALLNFAKPHMEQITSSMDMREIVGRTLVDKKTITDLVKKEIQKLSPKQREKLTDGTGIPWVDIWLSKLTKMQAKIVRFMAVKFPLPMTKNQIALGTAYSAKGGAFNQSFRELVRWKILEKDGDRYKLSEGPPG